MRKSTIAAIAAAAVVGFGAMGSANATTEISGFADIQYQALATNGDAFSADGQSGNFRGSGEVDVIQTGDGATFRADFDVLDALNTTPQTDVPSGTFGLGLDVEQLNVNVPIGGMASITAGVQDSPFGYEGQDATDYPFVANGLLWQSVPSVIVGGVVNVAPMDMLSINVGFINSREDATGMVSENANDWVATVTANIMDGLSGTVGYITDNGMSGGTVSPIGNQLDVNVSVDMVPNLSLAGEYLLGDPATGTGNLDSGYGLHASYDLGVVSLAARYEAATYEGAVPDVTWTSGSVSYPVDDATTVRFDWTNMTVKDTVSSDAGTIQLVHTFGKTM
jgi:Putative beta-barrel porin-2, OmpL-like. bbp2